MDQQHLLPQPTEYVTDMEVRELIERFGEEQTLAQSQPTVNDVAEALQVTPGTVAKMLQELRASKDQDEINSGLDDLEKENAELLKREMISSGFHSPFRDASVRVPFLMAMIASIVVVQVASMAFGRMGHEWYQQFAAIVLLFLPLFFVGKKFNLGRRKK